MLCSFSVPDNQLIAPETIKAFLGVSRDCWWDTEAVPVSWVADKPVELPKFVGNISSNPYGMYKGPSNPARAVFEPHLDKEENIVGLSIAQGEVQPPDAKGTRTWDSLDIERSISLPPSISPETDINVRLAEARLLWKQIMEARRANDWKRVGKLETQLSVLLGS